MPSWHGPSVPPLDVAFHQAALVLEGSLGGRHNISSRSADQIPAGSTQFLQGFHGFFFSQLWDHRRAAAAHGPGKLQETAAPASWRARFATPPKRRSEGTFVSQTAACSCHLFRNSHNYPRDELTTAQPGCGLLDILVQKHDDVVSLQSCNHSIPLALTPISMRV